MMKKRGHYCHVCGKHRASEKFSGKGHAKHVCKECAREQRTAARARKKATTSKTVFVQVLAHPERKLIIKRAVTATDYFAYCAEVGCSVWDDLKSVTVALGEPIGLWFPPAMRPAGTSMYAQGVEVPVSYDGQTPEGFDMVTFPSGWLMFFQGQPYKDDRFDEAIGEGPGRDGGIRSAFIRL